jgi:hypothetical protein
MNQNNKLWVTASALLNKTQINNTLVTTKKY